MNHSMEVVEALSMLPVCCECAYTCTGRNARVDGCISCEYAPEGLNKCLECAYKDPGCPNVCPPGETC